LLQSRISERSDVIDVHIGSFHLQISDTKYGSYRALYCCLSLLMKLTKVKLFILCIVRRVFPLVAVKCEDV
jgi:hypothetical protein